MDDLISRQAVLEATSTTLKITGKENAETVYAYIKKLCDDIKALPSAQKKGHWRNYEGTLTCSVCETEFYNGIMEYCGDDVPMFCPNCGADMRGEEAAEKLKSVPRWIPCSERLPERNGYYLVTGRQGAVNKRLYQDGYWYGNWAIIAWMPLPDCYQGDENNKMPPPEPYREETES